MHPYLGANLCNSCYCIVAFQVILISNSDTNLGHMCTDESWLFWRRVYPNTPISAFQLEVLYLYSICVKTGSWHHRVIFHKFCVYEITTMGWYQTLYHQTIPWVLRLQRSEKFYTALYCYSTTTEKLKVPTFRFQFLANQWHKNRPTTVNKLVLQWGFTFSQNYCEAKNVSKFNILW